MPSSMKQFILRKLKENVPLSEIRKDLKAKGYAIEQINKAVREAIGGMDKKISSGTMLQIAVIVVGVLITVGVAVYFTTKQESKSQSLLENNTQLKETDLEELAKQKAIATTVEETTIISDPSPLPRNIIINDFNFEMITGRKDISNLIIALDPIVHSFGIPLSYNIDTQIENESSGIVASRSTTKTYGSKSVFYEHMGKEITITAVSISEEMPAKPIMDSLNSSMEKLDGTIELFNLENSENFVYAKNPVKYKIAEISMHEIKKAGAYEYSVAFYLTNNYFVVINGNVDESIAIGIAKNIYEVLA